MLMSEAQSQEAYENIEAFLRPHMISYIIRYVLHFF